MPDPFDTNPAAYEKLLAKVLLGDNGAARASGELGWLQSFAASLIACPSRPDLREDLIQEVWTHLWSNNCRVLQ